MSVKRLIFHVDVNSAFLSWEAARRVKNGEADLRLIPSAIGGDVEKRTGVILAKSIPAKKYGIKTGEPVASAKRKCPELYLARPDFGLYARCSRAFMDICGKYAPVVEKFSIDECFLDMTGTERIYPDPVAIAEKIKDEIRDTLGFTVNVGIGENKLLAKTASDFMKPDRVHTLFSDEIEEKLWPLPVRELYSVGAATAEKLERAYILTVGELARADEAYVRRLVGDKMGAMIHNFANGIDDSPVRGEPEEAKGYGNSTTLERDITDAREAHRVLLALSDSVGMRMRADGVRARCVSVTVRYNDFRDRSHQCALPLPTDITDEIYETSKRLFSELWDKRTPLRLLGVSVTDLTRGEAEQLSMFSEEDEGRERARKLDRATDAIRQSFGADTIVRGSAYRTDINVGKKYKASLDGTPPNKTENPPPKSNKKL